MKRSDGRILTTHTGSLPRPKRLSGGEKQRVAITRALANSPDPGAGGDGLRFRDAGGFRRGGAGVVREKLRSLRAGADLASGVLF